MARLGWMAVVVAVGLAVELARASEHTHDHGEPCDHDHGHDTRSMYYTPDPEAGAEEAKHEPAQANGGHNHDHDHGDGDAHGHDHGHDTRSMYYTPDPEAGAEEAKHEPAQANGGHSHDHDHGREHSHGSDDSEPSHAHSHDHDPTHFSTDEGHGHGHDHDHDHGGGCGHDHKMLESPVNPRNLDADINAFLGQFFTDSKSIIWCKAISATVVISAAPAIMLLFIPLTDAESSKPLLKVLLAFAAGGLLGDALLHLIPHAMNPHDHSGGGHDHDHSHGHGDHGHDHTKEMVVGLWTLGGILAFMIVEKLVRGMKDGGHGHSHGGHSHAAPPAKPTGGDNKGGKAGKADKKEGDAASAPAGGDIKVAGYLNLAADFAHNFTDGLTLGAVFLHPEAAPWMTFVAILLHEVPHEIGDFAILIQSGCTPFQAIRLQLTTALGALSGTIVGLMSDSISTETSGWILPFTAGGFIYIATVGVIPELLEETTLVQSIMEILAFVAGVGTMVFIMFFE